MDIYNVYIYLLYIYIGYKNEAEGHTWNVVSLKPVALLRVVVV